MLSLKDMTTHAVTWKAQPEEGDFQAAFDFMTLLFPVPTVRRALERAHRVRATERIAKDILRASGLPLLPAAESHVARDLKKIRKRKALAPIILVRGDLSRGRPLVIADGYHRMCAAYHVDEDTVVNSVLVSP